jgi:hypothetical protein
MLFGIPTAISTPLTLDKLLSLSVLQETWTDTRDSEATKQCFIVLSQTQCPENKGVSPYVLWQADYRGSKIKKQGLTHIWLYAIL